MKTRKILWLLAFILSAGIVQAQDGRKYILPEDMEPETHTFSVPELQVSQSFIDSLEIVLFRKKYNLSEEEQSYRYFNLVFTKRDSVNYSIRVSRSYHPGRNSWGFFESEGSMYSFYGDKTPDNIMLGTLSEEQFSYTAWSFLPNWLLWDLIYNSQTGKITLVKTFRI